MPCFHPNQAWVGRYPTKAGKYPTVFKYEDSLGVERIYACKQCVGCRMKRSAEWAVRLMHEYQMYMERGDGSSFITLTYNNKFLPLIPGTNTPTLVKLDFQLFMKRLRKRYGDGIKMYYAGEYGDQFGRPHFHAIIFGVDFVNLDGIYHSNRNGFKLYKSNHLASLWATPWRKDSYGFSSVGSVTFESAAYVARYIMKKINGRMKERHYRVIDHDTGEFFGLRLPEYSDMSKRESIGKSWYQRYKRDLVNSDEIVIHRKDGFKSVPIPKHYDLMLQHEFPEEHAEFVKQRKLAIIENLDDNTPERLAVKKKILTSRITKLIRVLED